MTIGALLLRAFGIKEQPVKTDPLAVVHCPVCGRGTVFSSGWGRSEADLWRDAYMQDYIDADRLADKLIALEERR